MFDLINSITIDTAALTMSGTLITMGVAFILGLFISAVYMKTNRSGIYTQGFILTLVMMPVIVALTILLIGSNVATAFGLAGLFSLIRFRSSMNDPKDVAYIFFTVAVGLALGVGYIGYSIIFAIMLCAFMFGLCKFNFGVKKNIPKTLKIVVPEDLDYSGTFDDVLNNYTLQHQIRKIKTIDLGSLFELTYDVVLDGTKSEKKFIDELRCRNGNLTITISMKEDEI